jgi:hypothetical protein
MFLRFVEKLSFVDAYAQNLAVGSITFYSLVGIGVKPIRVGEKFALKLEGGLAPKYISSARDRY